MISTRARGWCISCALSSLQTVSSSPLNSYLSQMQACGQGAPSFMQERRGDCKVPSRSPKRQLTVSPFRIARLQVLTETHQDPRWHFPALCGEGSRCSDADGSLERQTDTCSRDWSCGPENSPSCYGLLAYMRFCNEPPASLNNFSAPCKDAKGVLGRDDVSSGWI